MEMPHPHRDRAVAPWYEAAAVFIQDTIVREYSRVPFSLERVHLDPVEIFYILVI